MAITEAASPLTGPIPVVTERGWPATARTLAIHDYRFFLTSLLLGFMASWIARITQDWMLLELTGSVAAVGLAVTFQFAPVLLLGLWGGVVTDRFSRAVIVRITQTVTAAGALALALLALTDALLPWHIYALAGVTGLVAAVEGPARSALVTQIVPPTHLQCAIGLNATAFHVASLAGATGSGLLIAVWGAPSAIVAALACSAASAVTLFMVRPAPLVRDDRPPDGAALLEGLRYAGRKPAIRGALILIAVIATFGMTHSVLYAAAARDGFGTGAAGFGLYFAVSAIGAIIGAVFAITRRRIGLRRVALASAVFGATMTLAAAAVTESLFLIGLVMLSATRIYCVTGIEALFQLSAHARMRGRVAGVYFVTVAAGQCVGPLLVGHAAESWGLSAGFAIAGGVPLVAACAVAIIADRKPARRRVTRLRLRP